jgi:hypothetical protein
MEKSYSFALLNRCIAKTVVIIWNSWDLLVL